MKKYPVSIRPFGVHAVLIEWPEQVEEDILKDILFFISDLKRNHLKDNKWEFIPAYNSLTLVLRGEIIEFDVFKTQLNEWYLTKEETFLEENYLWRLPVCYDAQFGLDLVEVAEKLNTTIEEVIKTHTASVYTVYGIGFLPGFMYLGGLPKNLEVPRRETPRSKVAKGSVGLAGKQTGIYPQESPGGWNILGNCSVPIFDPKKENPCIVKVGDKVQFYAISKAEYDLHKIEAEVGIYQFEKIKIDA
ncbi:5-oxoprolinase subunit PxpB [Cellulophaga sp. HaHaR_3_176]|uniref:5-oxoprolinase subunit PxpB n=1 Tax=Cellulophaga sp. HaHaR_3_176 TaxID=1942464 RepID=UPI001C1F2BC4|nr:5-oxoprolinase subunit PxpB [Cellulophaga sp. HaHaR_3_176]QWX82667.1 5-oxoprolinase subunit PxpB [Cellulophaga sp. HaHaR_3_176]